MVDTMNPSYGEVETVTTVDGFDSTNANNQHVVVDEETLELIQNVYSMQRRFLQQLGDPRRDIERECGHPKIRYTAEEQYELYRTSGIARRVVQVMPKECWRVQPCVYEDEDPNTQTEFEQAWDRLGQSLRGPDCYHQDEQGSSVWEYLSRIDILSGIGQYGVLYLGLDDAANIADLSNEPPYSETRKLLFIRAFPEALVEIVRYDTNPSSRRFGQPVLYRVSINDQDTIQSVSTDIIPGTIDIHWSRILHVADNLSSSEIYGTPRSEPVLPYILDLKKLYGGSAEMYWKGAFPGISLESHPSLGTDLEVDLRKTKQTLRDYMNGLERYMSTVGFAAKSLAPQVVDPTPQIMVQLQAICIEIAIPMRIFMGSERGELASSQDDTDWNERVRERQNGYLTPRLIAPFVDMLIRLGVLPKPKVKYGKQLGYSIMWPDLTSQTEQEKAATALQRTQAFVQFITGNGELGVTLMDFLVFFMKFTEEEALTMVENAKKNTERLTQKLIDIATTPKPIPKAGQMAQGSQGGKGAQTVDAQAKKSPLASQRKKKNQ